MPGARHAFTKDVLNQNIAFIGCITSSLEEINNLAAIKSKFQPLQRQALASSLRAHQDGQVAEIEIDRPEVGKVLDGQLAQGCRI